MRLKKYEGNPILSPNPENEWESLVTCNPAAWYEDGTFYLFYRAAANDYDHTIQIGLATSKDGFHFERASKQPFMAYIPNNYDGGLEDPRVCKIEDAYYMTYAYRPYLPGRYWERVTDAVKDMGCPTTAPKRFCDNLSGTGLAFSNDLKSFKRCGCITQTNLDNRDVILFPEKINGKYVRLERPMLREGVGMDGQAPAIWMNFSDDLLTWSNDHLRVLARPEGNGWQSKKIGGSTPPLKTEKGWLVLYHGVGDDGLYRVGVMLLDLNDPTRILSKPDGFIMEPEYDYETKGFYSGCVFPTGNVIVDDTLYVYYGAGDIHCGVATCKMSEMMDYLEANRIH